MKYLKLPQVSNSLRLWKLSTTFEFHAGLLVKESFILMREV